MNYPLHYKADGYPERCTQCGMPFDYCDLADMVYMGEHTALCDVCAKGWLAEAMGVLGEGLNSAFG